MAEIILTYQAQLDIDAIIDNVIDYTGSSASGIKLFEDLHEKIDLIGFMPLGIGRLRDDGTREAFCRGYRIVYTITGNNVYITTIIHSRRCYPLINPR